MDPILFLCPHNAAKGILAEAYFNHRAQQAGLPFQADSAGTEPAAQIAPAVVDLLRHEGIALASRIPRLVTPDDLRHAGLVIAMGCALAELPGGPRQFTIWEDVPAASTDLRGSWLAIRRHV